MRITSGLLKNRILKSPKGSLVRPTSDKVRSAIFSSLGDQIDGCRFLDLFAGTGAVGIEAYSRGAKHITFVDINTDTVRENTKIMPSSNYRIIKDDIFRESIKESFDIIFIDPPYEIYKSIAILEIIWRNKMLAYNGVIVYEDATRSNSTYFTEYFTAVKSKKYGDTIITYLESKGIIEL